MDSISLKQPAPFTHKRTRAHTNNQHTLHHNRHKFTQNSIHIGILPPRSIGKSAIVIPDTMMSLYIGPAVPTIPLNDFPPSLQQLAAFVASIVQYLPFLCYVVDVGRFLTTAQKRLDQAQEKLTRRKEESKTAARSGLKRKRTTWFVSAALKKRLNEALSDASSEWSIWREIYQWTGSLRGVVALHTMLVNPSNGLVEALKSKEVLNKIELWPVSGRMLFVMLLGQLEMDNAILDELDFSWGDRAGGSLQIHHPIEVVTDED